jgi:hypothetical protein
MIIEISLYGVDQKDHAEKVAEGTGYGASGWLVAGSWILSGESGLAFEPITAGIGRN